MARMVKAISATYDPDTGEMRRLKMTPRFLSETSLMKADVLQDLLHAVEDLYRDAVRETFSRRRRRRP